MGLRGAWDSLVTCLANENFMSGKSAQVEHLQWTVSEKNWHSQLWLKCCGRQKKLTHFSYYKPVPCFCAWYISIRLGFSSRFGLLYHKYFYWNMWRILLRRLSSDSPSLLTYVAQNNQTRLFIWADVDIFVTEIKLIKSRLFLYCTLHCLYLRLLVLPLSLMTAGLYTASIELQWKLKSEK